jgi:type I restriction enzyme M protein
MSPVANVKRTSQHLLEGRTEDIITDLLEIQGWTPARPPKGQVLRQNEYKAFPALEDIFKGMSKTGSGDGYPDRLIIDQSTIQPLMVIEAKAHVAAFKQAIEESQGYAKACIEAGHNVIAIGIAGQEQKSTRIGVYKCVNGNWRPIVYEQDEISWIPTPDDVHSLLSSEQLLNLAPVVPSAQVLAQKADLMNRMLREAHVKDEYRPAYIGAMMLALWQTRGNIRRDEDHILRDVNSACEDAFKAGHKLELSKSLHIDEENRQLAASAWRIIRELEKLNVVKAARAHDDLGQLYETFFQYTGGNTIGQYFTPRHIARFMADLTEAGRDKIVIDPACGTGGFLISCMQRVHEQSHLTYEDAIKMIANSLVGYESEPVTAALCVANMILRGDGKTGIHKHDCFTADDFPVGSCHIALMNPPFPHEKTDTPSERFVQRALEALAPHGETRGHLAHQLVSKERCFSSMARRYPQGALPRGSVSTP